MEKIPSPEDQIKNEEDLLGYTSKYKPDIYKEEDTKGNDEVNKSLNQNKSEISTSISSSLDNYTCPNFRRKQTLSKGENTSSNKETLIPPEKQRKMSSPLLSYYYDSNEYFLKMHETPINYKNSQNFIKKEDFFNESEKIINNYFINNYSINIIKNNNSFYKNNIPNVNNYNIIPIPESKIIINDIPYNNINFQNYNQHLYNINNVNDFDINIINENMNKRKLSYNVDGSFISNYFNNILGVRNNNQNDLFFNFNQSNLAPSFFSYNESQEKKLMEKTKGKKSTKSNKNIKKPLEKRKGDWKCPKCDNLNFAFRIVCNICHIPKPVK